MAESPPLRYVARRLLANLAAGSRLAFGAPVSLVSFRVSVPQFLALTLLLWVVAGLDDLINVGLDGRFNIFGLLQQVFFSLLFVLASLALARLYRHPHLALALPVLLAAGELPIDATHLLLSVADTGEFLSDEVKTASWWVLLIWFTVMAARRMAVAVGPSGWRRTQRALVAGCVFTGLTLVGLSL